MFSNKECKEPRTRHVTTSRGSGSRRTRRTRGSPPGGGGAQRWQSGLPSLEKESPWATTYRHRSSWSIDATQCGSSAAHRHGPMTTIDSSRTNHSASPWPLNSLCSTSTMSGSQQIAQPFVAQQRLSKWRRYVVTRSSFPARVSCRTETDPTSGVGRLPSDPARWRVATRSGALVVVAARLS